jgi:hypothetical protein
MVPGCETISYATDSTDRFRPKADVHLGWFYPRRRLFRLDGWVGGVFSVLQVRIRSSQLAA